MIYKYYKFYNLFYEKKNIFFIWYYVLEYARQNEIIPNLSLIFLLLNSFISLHFILFFNRWKWFLLLV